MNLVLANLLKSFRKTHEIDSKLPEDKAFEYFVNSLIAQGLSPGKVQPAAITAGDDDAGIDGIIVVIDGEIVVSQDEAEAIFKRPKHQFEAEVVLTQVKTSESFSKADITNFSDGVYDFFSPIPKLPHGKWTSDARDLVFSLFENASKLKGGRPKLTLAYATTGAYRNEVELKAAFDIMREKVEQHGLFSSVRVDALGRDSLIERDSQHKTDVVAELPCISAAPYPPVDGITSAYVVVVRAKDLVNQLLLDENGSPRPFIFDENVRDFLGVENEVNDKMQAALVDSKIRSRFGIMNNGVTIISPAVTYRGTTFTLKQFQIVNGCQTSNTLLEQRASLTDDIVVTAKIVEVSDPEVISSIIRATNSQTKVDESAFLSLSPVARKIEKYFQARAQQHQTEPELFLERRQGQFRVSDVRQSRIIDLKDLFRAVAAFWFDRPDLAARYPAEITKDLRILLEGNNKEVVYFTAAMALYRVGLLISARKIPQDFFKARWHLLMCLKYVSGANETPNINHKKAEAYCDVLLDKMADENGLVMFDSVVSLMKAQGSYARDTIRTRTYIDSLKIAAKQRPQSKL
jgi:hypothetical protein